MPAIDGTDEEAGDVDEAEVEDVHYLGAHEEDVLYHNHQVDAKNRRHIVEELDNSVSVLSRSLTAREGSGRLVWFLRLPAGQGI